MKILIMENLGYIIIFTGLIPFVLCLSLFAYLIFKLLKVNAENYVLRYLLWTHIIFLFILSSIYLVYSIRLYCRENVDFVGEIDYLMAFTYIASVLFSLTEAIYSRFRRGIPVSVIVIVGISMLIIILLSVYIVAVEENKLLTFILKIIVFVNILFLAADYFYRIYRKESDSSEEIVYAGMMCVYNFIYLFYLIGIHHSFDSIFAIYANIAVQIAGCDFLFKHGFSNKYDKEVLNNNFLLLEGEVKSEGVSLKNRLLLYFEQEKPYLSKTITIEQVADKLNTNKTYLSRMINEELNKNFRELINFFRVREAMKIFMDNKELSVSELMEKSGFNNNASFTSAFKVNTGYTPGEWCKNIKNKFKQGG